MSLLQDVLRSDVLRSLKSEPLDKQLGRISLSRRNSDNTTATRGSLSSTSTTTTHNEDDGDDDELINVISLPGTPTRSRAPSRTTSRSSSPTRTGAASRPLRGPLHIQGPKPSNDPLKILPTEISQRIFGTLSVPQLANCARVSKRWTKSQTINYVWFQHYRKENFQDDSLPPGKWTKKESKQNWRVMFLQPSSRASNRGSGYSSPSLALGSGYQTPKEVKEAQWKAEANGTVKPGKIEMRGMYKEMGGRKAKTKDKMKVGSGGGPGRDKGGWDEPW